MSKILTINYTTNPPVIDSYAGEIGENRAVTLKIIPDSHYSDDVAMYVMYFAVEGGILPSSVMDVAEQLDIQLTTELTQNEILPCQLIGLSADGETVVTKSPVVKLCFGETITGEIVVDPETGDTIFDQIAELKEIADTLDLSPYAKKVDYYDKEEIDEKFTEVEYFEELDIGNDKCKYDANDVYEFYHDSTKHFCYHGNPIVTIYKEQNVDSPYYNCTACYFLAYNYTAEKQMMYKIYVKTNKDITPQVYAERGLSQNDFTNEYKLKVDASSGGFIEMTFNLDDEAITGTSSLTDKQIKDYYDAGVTVVLNHGGHRAVINNVSFGTDFADINVFDTDRIYEYIIKGNVVTRGSTTVIEDASNKAISVTTRTNNNTYYPSVKLMVDYIDSVPKGAIEISNYDGTTTLSASEINANRNQSYLFEGKPITDISEYDEDAECLYIAFSETSQDDGSIGDIYAKTYMITDAKQSEEADSFGVMQGINNFGVSKENSANKTTKIEGYVNDIRFPTTKAVVDYVESKISTVLNTSFGGDT